MKQKIAKLLLFCLLVARAHAQMDLPESGRVQIDGRLGEWARAHWMPLQSATDCPRLQNARWTAAWDDQGWLNIAIEYDDDDPILRRPFRTGDRIQIEVCADPAKDFFRPGKTQRYTLGLTPDATDTWLYMGDEQPIPLDAPIHAALTREQQTFRAEIRVSLYDQFDPTQRRRCRRSELFAGKEVGLRIVLIDQGATGVLGRLSNAPRKGAVQTLED